MCQRVFTRHRNSHGRHSAWPVAGVPPAPPPLPPPGPPLPPGPCGRAGLRPLGIGCEGNFGMPGAGPDSYTLHNASFPCSFRKHQPKPQKQQGFFSPSKPLKPCKISKKHSKTPRKFPGRKTSRKHNHQGKEGQAKVGHSDDWGFFTHPLRGSLSRGGYNNIACTYLWRFLLLPAPLPTDPHFFLFNSTGPTPLPPFTSPYPGPPQIATHKQMR